MTDERNAGDESDRLYVCWDLQADDVAGALDSGRRMTVESVSDVALRAGESSEPVAGDAEGSVFRVEMPPDIETMRRADPTLALTWRRALRDSLSPVLQSGGRILGLDVHGSYVVRRGR